MANRYLRASGNWNGPVWAATSGGAAGSAATPTSADDVFLTAAGATVTLTGNTVCNKITIDRGGFNTSSYDFTTNFFAAQGNGATTITFGSGTVTINPNGTWSGGLFSLSSNNTTVSASTSTIVYNHGASFLSTFSAASYNLGDVRINLGVGGSNSTTLNVYGSPAFRSLIIQSKNDEAHTVNFDNSATIKVTKFIATAPPASGWNWNLSIGAPGAGVNPATIEFQQGGSSYAENVEMSNINATNAPGSNTPAYIGPDSQTLFAEGWLLQDPPKISTLVDPLIGVVNGAEPPMPTQGETNTNWTAEGIVTQLSNGYDGGGYGIKGTAIER